MYDNDFAFIYKKNRNYFYAISRLNGKVVFSNYILGKRFPGLSHFFFISYRYHQYNLQLYLSGRSPILLISDIEIEYISSYRNEFDEIQKIVTFFDYHIGHGIENEDIFVLIIKTYWEQIYSSEQCIKKMKLLF